MRYWTECREFFRQFREQYGTTGSILPSSRSLARALTRPMREATGPLLLDRLGEGQECKHRWNLVKSGETALLLLRRYETYMVSSERQ